MKNTIKGVKKDIQEAVDASAVKVTVSLDKSKLWTFPRLPILRERLTAVRAAWSKKETDK